ncbi:hypothetical protein CC79DRAFT_1218331 [Sarocladium strictum]
MIFTKVGHNSRGTIPREASCMGLCWSIRGAPLLAWSKPLGRNRSNESLDASLPWRTQAPSTMSCAAPHVVIVEGQANLGSEIHDVSFRALVLSTGFKLHPDSTDYCYGQESELNFSSPHEHASCHDT